MSNLTMLDIAARTNNDTIVGLIEDVTTYSPEFREFLARTVSGTTYMVGRRTALPSSGFRNGNEGIASGKSTYVQEAKQLYYLDAQLQVDEAIVKADDRSIGDVLAQEGGGALESAIQTIGSQIYYGTSADANGFAGLSGQLTVDTVTAGGSSNTTSAYLIDMSLKGVHLVIGRDGRIDMPEWMKQQVTDSNSNPYMAWVSNISAYIGLQVGSANSVYRVKGIDNSNKLTDALGAQCLENVPVSRRGSLRWFMNRKASRTLQDSRSSVGYQSAGSDGRGAYAPAPLELAGVPITVTDSLLNTESV